MLKRMQGLDGGVSLLPPGHRAPAGVETRHVVVGVKHGEMPLDLR